MIKTDTIKEIYLFKEMSPPELEKIAALCAEREVIAGQEIFFSGQTADSFFVIRQGTVKIFRTANTGDDIQLTNLSTGAHFGEIPFLTEEKRTATAQATETTYLIEVPFMKLRQLLKEDLTISEKFHRSMSRFLASRLRNTTNDLSAAKETLLRHF